MLVVKVAGVVVTGMRSNDCDGVGPERLRELLGGHPGVPLLVGGETDVQDASLPLGVGEPAELHAGPGSPRPHVRKQLVLVAH